MNVDKDRGEMKRDEGRDEDYYQRKISIMSEKDVDIAKVIEQKPKLIHFINFFSICEIFNIDFWVIIRI